MCVYIYIYTHINTKKTNITTSMMVHQRGGSEIVDNWFIRCNNQEVTSKGDNLSSPQAHSVRVKGFLAAEGNLASRPDHPSTNRPFRSVPTPRIRKPRIADFKFVAYGSRL